MVKLISRFRNFILDCDGVIWHGNAAIASSVKAIDDLRASGAQVIFMTNNATKSRKEYVEKFKRLGISSFLEEDVFTSASNAADVCQSHGFQKVFAVGEQGLVDELKLRHINVVEENNEKGVSEEEFLEMPFEENVQAVVVGFDRNFTYRKLCLASVYLQKGAKLVATNPDASDRVGAFFMPGNGCSVASIQYSVNEKGENTIWCGKPERSLLDRILNQRGFIPEETLMVGDRLDTDIAFANGIIKSLLVLTGCTSAEDLKNSTIKPDFVAESLATSLKLEIELEPSVEQNLD